MNSTVKTNHGKGYWLRQLGTFIALLGVPYIVLVLFRFYIRLYEMNSLPRRIAETASIYLWVLFVVLLGVLFTSELLHKRNRLLIAIVGVFLGLAPPVLAFLTFIAGLRSRDIPTYVFMGFYILFMLSPFIYSAGYVILRHRRVSRQGSPPAHQ